MATHSNVQKASTPVHSFNASDRKPFSPAASKSFLKGIKSEYENQPAFRNKPSYPGAGLGEAIGRAAMGVRSMFGK